jgi:hypothetical protein
LNAKSQSGATAETATVAPTVAGGTVVLDDEAATVRDVIGQMIGKQPHEVIQVAIRVGAEAGVVMMIADTHVVTEAMETTTGVVVGPEIDLALARPAGTTALGMTTAIVMNAATTGVGTMIDIVADAHRNEMPLQC